MGQPDLNGPLNVNGRHDRSVERRYRRIVNNSVLSINSGAIGIFVSPGFTNSGLAVTLVQGHGLLTPPSPQWHAATGQQHATVSGVGTLTNNGTSSAPLGAERVQNNAAGSIQ